MRPRVAGAAVAAAPSTAPTTPAAVKPSQPLLPPPPQSPPPPPPPPPLSTPLSATVPKQDPIDTDADSASCPATGSTAPTARPTTRHRHHRFLAAPRATKAWFRWSWAWLRRTQSNPKLALNSPNTSSTHKHYKGIPATAAAAAATSPPDSTTPASSTSTFNTTSTAADTTSTASTISFADSLDGAGMLSSRYSNTSADSGVVPSPTQTSRPSTSQKTYCDRDPPLFGKPKVPFLDHNSCCDPTVAVPSVEQCMEVISVTPNSTLMHSGGMHSSGALRKVLEEKRDYLEGYTPLSFKHISRDFSQVYASVPRAWSSLSTALATMTSGVVYVLLPEGEGTADFPPGGHFSLNEWPYLGDDVTYVFRINAKNRRREIIYARPDLPPFGHLRLNDHVQLKERPDQLQLEHLRPDQLQPEHPRPHELQLENLSLDNHVQLEEEPAPEPLYAEFHSEFGYPLQRCLTPPLQHCLTPPLQQYLTPPLQHCLAPPLQQCLAPPLDAYKMGISSDGRHFTPDPNFQFGYNPDERIRGLASLIRVSNMRSQSSDGCKPLG